MPRTYACDLPTFLWIAIDLAAVILAWFLAFYLRFYTGLPIPKGIPDWVLYVKLVPFIAVVWSLVFMATGVYRRAGQHKSAFAEASDILRSSLVAVFVFIAVTYFYNEYRYSRVNLLLFAGLHPFVIIWGRSLLRKALRYYRKVAKPRDVLMIGGGANLNHALATMKRGNLFPGRMVGIVGVGNADELAQARRLAEREGIALVGVPESWADFFAHTPCQSVVIALPHHAYLFVDTELDAIANQVTDIKMIPDLLCLTKFSASLDIVDATPVINIHDSPLQGAGRVYKRLLDMAGAVVALLIFGPLMLVCAGCVRFSSPGPIFYRQERMGLDGRTFAILKFRTMPVAAEGKTGAVWAKRDDLRATRLGSLLRKTSLDELPQLFNVLKGDMSLVGPRPERPIFVNQFRKNVPGYMLRHKVKAGMTGWAQVNGWRGDTSIEKRIECDLFYIQNWSLWLDLKILILTVFKGFVNPNAY